MWSHPIVGHCPPRMICRRRLRKPDITSIARELTIFKSANDRVAVADFGSRRIYQIRSALHALQNPLIEETLSGWIKWRVNCNDVAHFHHLFRSGVISEPELTLNLFRKLMARSVVQFHIKWLESSQYGQSDPAGRDRTNVHSLKIVRSRDAVPDVPPAI